MKKEGKNEEKGELELGRTGEGSLRGRLKDTGAACSLQSDIQSVVRRESGSRHFNDCEEACLLTEYIFASPHRCVCRERPQGGKSRKGKGWYGAGTLSLDRSGPRGYLFMVERSNAVSSSGRSLRSSWASAKVNHLRSRFSLSGQSGSSLVTVTS